MIKTDHWKRREYRQDGLNIFIISCRKFLILLIPIYHNIIEPNYIRNARLLPLSQVKYTTYSEWFLFSIMLWILLELEHLFNIHLSRITCLFLINIFSCFILNFIFKNVYLIVFFIFNVYILTTAQCQTIRLQCLKHA